jgi:hypothetical protein
MTKGADFEAGPSPEDIRERLSLPVVKAVAPRAGGGVSADLPCRRLPKHAIASQHCQSSCALSRLVFTRPCHAPVGKSQRRRKTVSQEKNDAAQFHDNDSSEDIYDLYNACNGIMINGLLDIDRLDELNPAEKEEFDEARLREVWEHTATGCGQCATIIDILNRFRDRTRESTQRRAKGEHEPADVNVNEPAS